MLEVNPEENPGPPYTGDLLPLHNAPAEGELRFTPRVFQLGLPSLVRLLSHLPICKAEAQTLL